MAGPCPYRSMLQWLLISKSRRTMRFMRAADAPDDWWIKALGLLSQPRNCPAAKASLLANHHTLSYSGNRNVCLLSSHPQSSCRHHAVSNETSRSRLFGRARDYKRENIFFNNRRFKTNSFNFLPQPVSRLTKKYVLYIPLAYNCTY